MAEEQTIKNRPQDAVYATLVIVRQGKEFNVIFDIEDLPLVRSAIRPWYLVWRVRGYGLYAVHFGEGHRSIYLHRLIAGAKPGETVDHINHNTLDNRRKNLRVCSRLVNQHNRRGANRDGTSGHLGVTKTRSGKWCGKLTVNGKLHHVGTFSDPSDAAEAVKRKRSELLSQL